MFSQKYERGGSCPEQDRTKPRKRVGRKWENGQSNAMEWLGRGGEGTPPRWADIPLVRRAENIYDMEEPHRSGGVGAGSSVTMPGDNKHKENTARDKRKREIF